MGLVTKEGGGDGASDQGRRRGWGYSSSKEEEMGLFIKDGGGDGAIHQGRRRGWG